MKIFVFLVMNSLEQNKIIKKSLIDDDDDEIRGNTFSSHFVLEPSNKQARSRNEIEKLWESS